MKCAIDKTKLTSHIVIGFCRTLMSQSAGSVTVGSVAAFISTKGYEVHVAFIPRSETLGIQTLFQLLKDNESILILKINFQDYEFMISLAEAIKKQGLAKAVALCGPFALHNANSILKRHKFIDGIIKGQPEDGVLKFIRDIEYCSKISNKNKIYTGERTNLDHLPLPTRQVESVEVTSHVNIEASRGCNYGCTFCHHAKTPVQTRSSKRVVDEIEHLYLNLGKTFFIFNDPCFWSGQEDNVRILKMAKDIIDRKLDVRFYVYLRLKPFIDIQTLHVLTLAGLSRVFIGIESADEINQKGFHKPIDLSDFKEKRTILENDFGVNVHIGFITFGPYSTIKSIKSNIEFLYRIGKLFRLGIIAEPLRIIPGSVIHQKLIKDGLMKNQLSYDQITYGYNFSDPYVAVLFKEIHNTIRYFLGNIAYRFEYYSTAMTLLKFLANKELKIIPQEIEYTYRNMLKLRRQGENDLKYYFDNIINYLPSGQNREKEFDENKLILKAKLKETLSLLEVAYHQFANSLISTGAERSVREVYSGNEGLTNPFMTSSFYSNI